ncbi:MAG TPA: hypothetical protein EYP77_09140 [Anaerolineae bacterium]|nr:hypothetical protein [Anaerolineae bacterium]
MAKEFPGRGRVAVLRTQPETVLEDYGRLMELAGLRQALPQDRETILKVNISWQTWYPACSTVPFQPSVIRPASQNLVSGSITSQILARLRRRAQPYYGCSCPIVRTN